MSRQDTEKDIVATLGQIPDFFASMPDSALERRWAEFKEFQLADSVLTAREKHLIGYAVASAIHCPYCTYFHRSATQMMGTSRRSARGGGPLGRRHRLLQHLPPQPEHRPRGVQAPTDEIGAFLAGKAAEAPPKAA